ncbi:MAG: response regulator transcription factor [Sulfurospirillaceae bacterium]|nr:response regulator transcription factor [Sulfurospirillaceae bacterium]
MKILLLEDNQRLSNLIREACEQKNYHIDLFENGKTALQKIDNGYDCFILDINVPGINGLSFLKDLRLMDKITPAIIISANDDLETIQEAYEKGCDDYLKKPFYMYELETKLEKLCHVKDKCIKFSNQYFYNVENEKLFNEKSEEIKLSKKEILLLNLFAKNKDKITTHEEIELHVWEGDLTTSENIRALIKRLRKKMPKNSILSQGGMGYKINYL